jgi:hypothetical protein
MQFEKQIKFVWFSAIKQVPLRMHRRPRAEYRCRKTVEQNLNRGPRLAATRPVSPSRWALNRFCPPGEALSGEALLLG